MRIVARLHVPSYLRLVSKLRVDLRLAVAGWREPVRHALGVSAFWVLSLAPKALRLAAALTGAATLWAVFVWVWPAVNPGQVGMLLEAFAAFAAGCASAVLADRAVYYQRGGRDLWDRAMDRADAALVWAYRCPPAPQDVVLSVRAQAIEEFIDRHGDPVTVKHWDKNGVVTGWSAGEWDEFTNTVEARIAARIDEATRSGGAV